MEEQMAAKKESSKLLLTRLAGWLTGRWSVSQSVTLQVRECVRACVRYGMEGGYKAGLADRPTVSCGPPLAGCSLRAAS